MSCGDPGKPLNGYRTGNEFWAGNMVFYTCDPGYYLVGSSNRLCLKNGAWSDSIPLCRFLSLLSKFKWFHIKACRSIFKFLLIWVFFIN